MKAEIVNAVELTCAAHYRVSSIDRQHHRTKVAKL
jgi:hypothetical protein